jgi:hypothetical protein
MPILTVTQETLEALGVSSADIQEPILTGHAKRSLDAMLASRGFDVASRFLAKTRSGSQVVDLSAQADHNLVS